MAKLSVSQFAAELGLPVALLLEQLKAAGIVKDGESDSILEKDKAQLLDHLRQAHGGEKPAKMTVRRDITEIKKADSSGRVYTIQVERLNHRELPKATIAPARPPLNKRELSKEFATQYNHKRQLRVEGYFSKAKTLLSEHPPESLNNMRKAAEAICKDILDETFEKKVEGKTLKPASAFASLEDMTQEIKRRKQIPISIEKYLTSLQLFGNYGSHDQELDQVAMSFERAEAIMANSMLLQLEALVDWYKAFDLSAVK